MFVFDLNPSIRALPGAGKSYLAKLKPKEYVDSDVLISELAPSGGHKRSDFYAVVEDPVLKDKLRDRVLEVLQTHTLLANFDTEEFLGIDVAIRVGYDASEYLEHLELAGRDDLTENFDAALLKEWCDDLSKLPNYVSLPAGEYLGNLLESKGGKHANSSA